MDIKWNKQIDDIISKRVSLTELSELLHIIKNEGVSQSDVEQYLNRTRDIMTLNEEIDDWILEILDVVTGFCNEKYRVW